MLPGVMLHVVETPLPIHAAMHDITRYLSPGGEGVRLDSCVFGDYEFPKAYDSLGALLMTYGDTWEKTGSTMERALSEYFIGGLKTTIPFHQQLLTNPYFKKGDFSTHFVQEMLKQSGIEKEE